MRVALINAYYGIGSTGKIVKDISQYLIDESVENIIFCSVSNEKKNNVRLVGNVLDHKIHALLSRLTGKQGYYSKRATIKMLKMLDEFAPDVVHIHNIHSNYLNFELLFSYLAARQIRTVITLHDCFLFTGKCVHYTQSGCYKWKEQCGQCPNLNSGNPVWLFDKTKELLFDKRKWYTALPDLAVIGVSKWVTAEARRSILSCANQIETIYNWVDFDTEKSGEYSVKETVTRLPADKRIVLSIASIWTDRKGINDIYKLADMSNNDFCYVIIGECKEKKKKENILYLGNIGNQRVLAEIYKRAMVYFHPSQEETFGLVIAEAMSFGTPVIVYNSTACPELVGDNCGFIVSPGDVGEVYEDICMIARKGKDYYSIKCREHVRKYFNKEIGLRKTYMVYHERFN